MNKENDMQAKLTKILNAASSLILAAAILLTALCVFAPNAAVAAWDGTVSTAFYSGSGTQASPYIIKTPQQMGYFLTQMKNGVTYEGKYIQLGANIDMTGYRDANGEPWSYADSTGIFAGTFSGDLNGRGYTVTVDFPFLPDIGAAGVVQGLNLVGSGTVSGEWLLCRTNEGTLLGNAVRGRLNESGATVKYAYAGLLCKTNIGTIQGCFASGSTYAYGDDTDNHSGMVAENSSSGLVEGCYSAVLASGTGTGKYSDTNNGPVAALSHGQVTGCYYDKTVHTGSYSLAAGMTTQEMQSAAVLTKLSAYSAVGTQWTKGTDGYPVLKTVGTAVASVSGYEGMAEAAYHTSSTTLTLTKTAGTIYYTTDGSDPTTSSTRKTGTSVTITGDTVVSVVALSGGQYGKITRIQFISLPGSGTEADPYQIRTKLQLDGIRLEPSASYKLMNNLTFDSTDYSLEGSFSNGWTPISSFAGTFDGNEKAVYNLSGTKGGLFASNSGVIKNLRIVDHTLIASSDYGAVANSNGGTITRCYVKSAYTADSRSPLNASSISAYVGGITGSGGTVTHCRVEGVVISSGSERYGHCFTGGIVGSGSPQSCVFDGLVMLDSSGSPDYSYTGGIAGSGSNPTNNWARLSVLATTYTDYGMHIGGINGHCPSGWAYSCVADSPIEVTTLNWTSPLLHKYTWAYHSANGAYESYRNSANPRKSDYPNLDFTSTWMITSEGIRPQGVMGADGHAWTYTSCAAEATCTETGSATLTCAICGATKADTLPALGHKTELQKQADPTCTENGYTGDQVCVDCGETIIQGQTVPATGHVFADGVCVCGLQGGSFGEGLGWTLDASGLLTIRGSGAMPDFDPVSTCPWNGSAAKVKQVVFDGEITYIGTNTFYNCSNLTGIALPAALTGLGDRAFFGCQNLPALTLPGGVETIGIGCFYGCHGLTELALPQSLKTLGASAFADCDNLLTMTIPQGVTELPINLFTGCFRLTSVTVPDTVTGMGYGIFLSCPELESFTFPAGMTEVPDQMFMNCYSLREVALPENVQRIGAEAFKDCGKLTSFTVPATVTELGDQAFHTSGLTQITFEGSAPTFGANTFGSVTALAWYSAEDATWTQEVRQNYGGTITWHAVGVHEPVLENQKDAACGLAGYTGDQVCTICGEILAKGETIPATGHSYASVVTAPTCTEGGYTTYTCSACDDSYTGDAVDALGHSYEAVVTDPTCTVDGYTTHTCATCGHAYQNAVVTAPGHSFTPWEEVIAPTCEEKGLNCRICTECSHEETEDVKALGHSYGEWEEITAPTCTDAGQQMRTCATCSQEQTKTLAALGHRFQEGVCIGCGAYGGTCGEDLTWVLDAKGLMTISGTGDMYAFDYSEGAPWKPYKDLIFDLVFEGAPTSVSRYAFKECVSLEEVKLPASLTEIGDSAFYGCTSLTEIAIPDSVTTLGYGAFWGCSGLTKAELPDSITVIPTRAFYVCRNLAQVRMPANLKTIGDYAFYQCLALEDISFPETLTSIGREAFYYCDLKEVVLPAKVTSLGASAFSSCYALERVVLPDNLLVLSEYVFSSCSSLKEITLPANLRTIGKNAFNYCTGLQSITIPAGVINIQEYAFDDARDLQHIEFLGDVPRTINANAFAGGVTATAVYPGDNETWTEEVRQNYGGNIRWVPSGSHVHVFDENDLCECGIRGGFCHAEGSFVLWTLDQAGNFTLSGSGATADFDLYYVPVPWLAYLGEIKTLTVEEGITAIGSIAFQNCENLTAVSLPQSLTAIGSSAFRSCVSLQSITLPEGLTTLGSYALGSCTSLKEITIPDSVTELSNGALASCSGLTSVALPQTLTAIGDTAFASCTGLESIEIPASVTTIGASAFKGCTKLDNVVLPEGLTVLKARTFYCCTALTTVHIPESVVEIQDYAFYGCAKLSQLDLGNVQTIGYEAFYECKALTAVDLSSLRKTEGYAFRDCTNLAEVGSLANLETIGVGTFRGCNVLNFDGDLTSARTIGQEAFLYCYGITGELTFSENLEAIGERAFSRCRGVTSVKFAGGLTVLETSAFADCNIRYLELPATLTELKDNGIVSDFQHGMTVRFLGDAPLFSDYALGGVFGAVYYPADNATWTEEVRQSYDGSVVWLPDEGHCHVFDDNNLCECGTLGGYIRNSDTRDTQMWTLDQQGHLQLRGTGETPAFSSWDIPWGKYSEQILTASVCEGITSLCSYAFNGCTALTDVELPSTLTHIGGQAFGDCTSLTEIVLPQGLTSVGNNLFSECTGLTRVTLPGSLETIGEGMFSGCTALTQIVIPAGVPNISYRAFDECTSLEEIHFQGDAPAFNASAFLYLSDTIVYYPSGNDTWTEAVRQSYGGTNIRWHEEGVHPTELRNQADATCTESGYTGDQVCAICGEILAKGETIPAIAHSLGEWTEVTAPTCTEEGLEKRTCESCGYEQTRTLEAPGHSYTAEETGATCTLPGYITYTCRCGISYQEIVSQPKGHSHTAQVIAPTCTAEGYTLHTCHCGDSYTDTPVEATGHSYGVWYTVTNPTCQAEGQQGRDCKTCGQQETQAVNKAEHSYAAIVTAPTCTAKGYTTHTCTYGCGSSFVDSYVDMVPHSFQVYTANGDATCEENGTVTATCQFCSATDTHIQEGSALGHDYAETVIAPTCTEQGYTIFQCTRCDAGYQDAFVEATGHSYEAVTTAPTCTDQGYTTYTCHCGHSYTDAFQAATGHSFGDWVEQIAPTCTSQGSEVRTCAACGHSETRPTAMGTHSWDEGQITVQPTEETEGQQIFTCTACGETRSEVLPKLDHVHDYTAEVTAPTCVHQGYTTYTCGTCGHSYQADFVPNLEHVYAPVVTAPTCTEQGYTTHFCVCGLLYVDSFVEAAGHSYTETVTPPTCDTQGYTTHACGICGYTFTDSQVPATGHSYEAVVTAPTCADQGYTTHTCVCGHSYTDSFVAALGHAWDDGVITQEPSYTAPGVTTFTCGTCGEERTQSIPMLESYVTFRQASVSLAGDIGLNFYVEMSPNIASDPGSFLRFTFNGETQDVPVSQAILDSKGQYRFSCKLAARNMADLVTAQMHTSQGAVAGTETFSVQEYCTYVINYYAGTNQQGKLVNLLKAMLNYGAQSQISLGYRVDTLANAGLSAEDRVLPNPGDLSAYAHSAVGAEPGIQVASASLLLKTTTTIRVYFQLTGNKTIDQYSFTAAGKAVTPVKSGGLYYVDLAGVEARNLDAMYAITCGGLTVNYCGLSYVKSTLEYPGFTQNAKNMARALYGYARATNAYFPS